MNKSEQQAKAMIATIAQEAEQIWGRHWKVELTREYCRLESLDKEETIEPVRRRSQLMKALKEGNPTAETLMRLARAVGAEVQIALTRREVKRF